ncbi:MAG: SDR family NAD(P)-dependent oxidoreductase [Deltaproteobacteria bacterium]|nr:SDR family NAD(P)-dependent oxidoreductase [Deltaproteobacteria bacterium]
MSSRLTRLRGRRALVTGASGGIGRALALRLAAEGARVVLVARRADALEALAAEVRAAGGEALALPCDVAEREAVAAAAAHVVEVWGGVDLLVNNAGYGHHRRFLEWDLEDMERMLRVNTLGSLYWTKALLPGMVERGEGWIVFVASLAGRIAPPDESAYAASKFALVGLAESLSLEVEDLGVHVLTVCPGVIRTPFFDREALERMPAAARRQMVEPDGLVEAILGALRSGRRELTYPRMLAGAYAVRALFPRFFRWGVKRTAKRPDQTGSEGAE